MAIRGSCHCGKVAYRLDAQLMEAMECNCSICRRNGYLLAFVSPDAFTLETSRDAITTYTFNKHAIRHQFCSSCGCAPFGEGEGPGGPMVAVNLRCAEDFDLGALKIVRYDGANLA